jgi:hypothetical protein
MGDQVRKAFENLGAVLQAAGLGGADVVKVNYYTTDVGELIGVLGPLAAEFFRGQSSGINPFRGCPAGLPRTQGGDRSNGRQLSVSMRALGMNPPKNVGTTKLDRDSEHPIVGTESRHVSCVRNVEATRDL